MRWEDMRRSENVEERSGGMPFGIGGGMGLGGGAILVVVVLSLLLGKNPLEMLALLSGGEGPSVQTQSVPAGTPAPGARPADPQREFVARVLGDTEDVWGDIFTRMGKRYEPPKLALFHGQVESGIAAAMAVGDDRLQQRARGYIVPEEFTHGSSEQRANWFKIGLNSGDVRKCNSFASREMRAQSGGGRTQ